jgi:uncharacterized DUF497 family protein
MYTVRMSLRFEWAPAKDAANQRKHGVAFGEAQTTFYDEEALLINDPEHSAREHRFVLLGMSSTLRVLVVSHCYRGNDDVIRIISARRANRHEQRQYKERYGQ